MKNRTVLLILPLVLTATVIGVALASRSPQGLMRQLERSTPERTFAARLSISTEYSRCTQHRPRGGETIPREECADAGEGPLSLRELRAAAKSAHPDSLQAYGLATVIWWDDKEVSLDAAILRLEKALRLSPGSVALRVDLSAAHLARAERTWNPRDLLQALHYAGEALARERRNAAAWFNAALALQAFGLDWAADEAWNSYLAIDSRSEWAAEARERKRGLMTHVPQIAKPAPGAPDSVVRRFAAEYPQEARELGWDRVLGGWGTAVQAGDRARAASLLDFADQLGRALTLRRGGDASLADAVRAIRAAESNAAATMALARAHQAYAEGVAAVRKAEYPIAGKVFSRVVDHPPPSPALVQWATAFRAAVGGYKTAEERRLVLLWVFDEADSTHPALAGRARKALAKSLFDGGAYQEAHEQSSVGGELLLGAGETEFAGELLSLAGEAAYESGDTVEAYRLLHRAQLALRPYAGSQASHNQLTAVGTRAVRDEMPHAARTIYDESVRGAERTGLPVNVVEALWYRAHALTVVDDSLGSARDMNSAFVWSGKVPPDHQQRAWVDAIMRMARSDKPSVAAMDSTVETLSSRNVWLIPALLWRADGHLVRDNISAAIRDLDSATALIHGSKPDAVWLRAAMMERARSQFDQLVRLYLWQDRTEEALHALEQGRVSLRPRRAGTRAASAGRLPKPRGYVAVDYAFIGDTLLAWLVLPESTQLFRTQVDRDTFRLTVEQAGAALESGASAKAVHPNLQRLYDWLIRPMRDHLPPPETPLVIVADGEVASVPFEALWDEGRGRYLVQDHLLVHAPTLANARPPSRPRGHAPALLVANPSFEPLAYPTLDSLGGAEAEVEALRGTYPGADVLQAADATPERFVALARDARLIHYAGHAMFDDARPERSFLLLAGTGATGRLTAQAVDSMELRGAPLVVLSACRTLRSSTGRSGGFAGLSGALLEAGASGVVGSLWQADDKLTQPLMQAFHRHYQHQQMDAARALRAAQLQMIDAARSPAAWAGFRYMGN